MARPFLNDTIVALASGRHPSAVGIVRLSGPKSCELLACILHDPARLDSSMAKKGPRTFSTKLSFSGRAGFQYCVPARILQFTAPRSFSGQDLIEIHTIGALPLLDVLVETLVWQGARPATAGEFTARAFLNGKVDRAQVEGILGLVHAQSAAAANYATRSLLSESHQRLSRMREEILDLLSRVEAGIDFVDEEGIRFVGDAELREAIDVWLRELEPFAENTERLLPHVILAGLPNAGKSALFNALIGTQRSIVNPRAGTTRDVVSSEVNFDGISAILQDSAGLGPGVDALDRAAISLANDALRAADLVIFLHDQSVSWSDHELRYFSLIPANQRLLVYSKCDLCRADSNAAPFEAATALGTSTHIPNSVAALRAEIKLSLRSYCNPYDSGLTIARRSLCNSRQLCDEKNCGNVQFELLAGELRRALECLSAESDESLEEQVLDRIFRVFCIGK